MTLRRCWAAASLLMLVVKVVSGQTVACHQTEYRIGNYCCPKCLQGSRVRRDCTEFRSTSCVACSDGTYMNKPTGLKLCFPCTTCDEGSGLKTKTSCTRRSDSVCEPLEGFYCVEPSDNDCDAAKRHRRCEPGQFISKKGTASSDSECSACSQGTFSDGSFTSCRPHTQCESKNLQVLRRGTASSDADCGEIRPKKKIIRIILIILLAVVLLALIVFAVFLVWWKRKKKIKRKDGVIFSRLGRSAAKTTECSW